MQKEEMPKKEINLKVGDSVYYRKRIKGSGIRTIVAEVMSVEFGWANVKRLTGHRIGKRENIRISKLNKK